MSPPLPFDTHVDFAVVDRAEVREFGAPALYRRVVDAQAGVAEEEAQCEINRRRSPARAVELEAIACRPLALERKGAAGRGELDEGIRVEGLTR
jgi:hypothetical protein